VDGDPDYCGVGYMLVLEKYCFKLCWSNLQRIDFYEFLEQD
jgi:hypothetical protein